MKAIILYGLMLFGAVSMTGCGKSFLDIKQNSSQAVPHTIADFQAILDNGSIMNVSSCHLLGMLGGDEFFVQDGALAGVRDAFQRNGYVWNKEVFEGEGSDDWDRAYERILLANLSLEGVSKIKPQPGETPAWNNVKGSALFFRALNFYQLAQLFCKPYDVATADTEPGIPLRLESDINLRSVRGTVAQTYHQIVVDLEEAADLLPDVPLVKRRPSRPAAHAMLAKTYLLMGDYENAKQYAGRCLDIRNTLVDLNALPDMETYYPIATAIPQEEIDELIFLSSTSNIALIAPARFNAASDLLDSYTEGDLRKEAWFFTYNGRTLFGGGYISGYSTGLGVNEVLLIRAECLARTGEIAGALADLNYLLENRHNESYRPLSIQDPTLLLDRIIDERRKELLLRGVRWEDLRRLNKDPRYARTLVRVVDGERYELPPNDPRYVWPIPDKEILMSGIEQNVR